MTDHRYKKVRVKATGEVGTIAIIGAHAFYAQTHFEHNAPSVRVLIEATGEIRTYLRDALEDVSS